MAATQSVNTNQASSQIDSDQQKQLDQLDALNKKSTAFNLLITEHTTESQDLKRAARNGN